MHEIRLLSTLFIRALADACAGALVRWTLWIDFGLASILTAAYESQVVQAFDDAQKFFYFLDQLDFPTSLLTMRESFMARLCLRLSRWSTLCFLLPRADTA